MIRIGLQAGSEQYWFEQTDGWIPLHDSVQGRKQDTDTLEVELILAGVNQPTQLRQRLIELRSWERRQFREQLHLLIDDTVSVEAYPITSLLVDDTPRRLLYWGQGYGTIAVTIRAKAQPSLLNAVSETIVANQQVQSLGTIDLNTQAVEALELDLEHDPTATNHPGCYTLALTPQHAIQELPLQPDGVGVRTGFIAQGARTELVAVVRGTPASTVSARLSVVPPFQVVRAIQQPTAQELRLSEGELALVWNPQQVPPGWSGSVGSFATATGPGVLTVPPADALVVLRGVAFAGSLSGSVWTRNPQHQLTLPGSGTRLVIGVVGGKGYWSQHGYHALPVTVSATRTITPVPGVPPFWLHDQNTLNIHSGNVAVVDGALVESPETREYTWSLLVFNVQNPSTLQPGTYLGVIWEETPSGPVGSSELLQVTVPRHHAILVDATSDAGYALALYLRPLTSTTWYRTDLSTGTIIRSLGQATSFPTSVVSEIGVLTAELSSGVLGFRRSSTRFTVGRRQLVSVGLFATNPGTWYVVRARVSVGTIERIYALAEPQWLTVAAPGGMTQKLKVRSSHNRTDVSVAGGQTLVESNGGTALTHSTGWWTVSVSRWTRQALDEWGQGLPAFDNPVRDVEWSGEWLRRATPSSGAQNVLGIFSPVPAPPSIRVLIVYRRYSGTNTSVTFTLRAVDQGGTTLSEVTSGALPFDDTVRTAELALAVSSTSLAGYYVVADRREDLSYTMFWSENTAGDRLLGIYNGSAFGDLLRLSPPVLPGRHGRLTLSQSVGTTTVYWAERSPLSTALHGDAERWWYGAGLPYAPFAVEPGQPLVIHLLQSSGGTPQWRWVFQNGTTLTVTLATGVNVLTVPANAVRGYYSASTTSSSALFNWFSRSSDQPSNVEEILSRSTLRAIALPTVIGASWAIALRYAASTNAGGQILSFSTSDGATWELTLTSSAWVVKRNGSVVVTVPRPSNASPRTLLLTQSADGVLWLRDGQPGAWTSASTTVTPSSLAGPVQIRPDSIEPVFAARWLAVITTPTQEVLDGTKSALGSTDPVAMWEGELGASTIVYDPMKHPFAIVRGLVRPGFARGALVLHGPSTLFVVAQRDLVTRDIEDTTINISVRGLR